MKIRLNSKNNIKQNEIKNKMLNWSDFRLRKDDLKNKSMMKTIDIKDVSIAEEIRKQMAVATANDKGLMPNSFVYSEKWNLTTESLVLYNFAGGGSLSTSILISVGAYGGGPITTYHLSMNRSMNVLTKPNLILNKIAGANVPQTPRFKLFLNETTGDFKIIFERTIYTPNIYAKLLVRSYAAETISLETASPSEVSQAEYIEVS